MTSMELRGPVLSVPATRPELIDKALASGAAGVIIDLEDAVADSDKDEARGRAVDWLAGAQSEVPVVVRINQVGSPWCHLDAIAVGASLGIRPLLMLPKAESAGDIHFLDRLLTGSEPRELTPLRLIALLESAAGIAAAMSIATASARMAALSIGYADLGADLGRRSSKPHSWDYAQQQVLTAGRAAGLTVIDGPSLGVDLDERFDASLSTAVEAGFDAKWVLHPRQVAVVTAAFAPSIDEIELARSIIAALDAATAQGAGVTRVGNLMVDEAVAVSARRVLALAAAAGSSR